MHPDVGQGAAPGSDGVQQQDDIGRCRVSPNSPDVVRRHLHHVHLQFGGDSEGHPTQHQRQVGGGWTC